MHSIKEIVINEYYTGWGEFARDGISDFLRSVLPVKIRDYSDWYGACLYDKDDKDMETLGKVEKYLSTILDEGAVKSLKKQLTDDTIANFNAEITTRIVLKTGNITKEYTFEEM